MEAAKDELKELRQLAEISVPFERSVRVKRLIDKLERFLKDVEDSLYE